MAMGNFCYIQNIECPYATALGTCRDDIYSDFNKMHTGKSVTPAPNAGRQCGG